MENTNEYKGLNVGDITVMKNITYTDVDAIRQIANFHTEMLQDNPMAQKGKTAMMCALYEEMIQRRLKYEQEYIYVLYPNKHKSMPIFGGILTHHQKQ